MDNSDFFSVDKLVEFGLGIAISQQMVASMNQAIQNSTIPGAMNIMPQNNPVELFYFVFEGKANGPFSGKETIDLLKEGKLSKDVLAWKPGMSEWKKIEEVPEILKYIALSPPALPKYLI